MEKRSFGRLGRTTSVIGLGTWQLGADWGTVDDDEAMRILFAAVDAGVDFIDTADVYGDGRSELFIGRLLKDLGEAARPFVATKMGRKAPQNPREFHRSNFQSWVDESRRRLGVEQLDLVQLHCPPSAVVAADAVYDALDEIVDSGDIGSYGVSVETCDDALAAIARPNVASIQIILNPFRLRPSEEVLPAAAAAGVGIIARVPLASGLLSGRFGPTTRFADDDHRAYNRNGEAFDVGETFSGVPYELGVEVAGEFAALAPPGATAAQLALRWVVEQPGVTVVIPGATSVEQVRANVVAGDGPPLDSSTLRSITELYDRRIRPLVHDRW